MHEFQKHLTDAINQYDFDVQSYSGRAMYGKSCLAITGDNRILRKAIAYAIVQAQEAESDPDCDAERLSMSFEDYVESILDYRQDSMGLGTVIYWPQVEYTEVPYEGGCPDCGAPSMQECECE